MLVLCREPDRLDDGKNNRRSDRSMPREAFASQPYVNMRAVLQLVILDARVRQSGDGQPTSGQLNERLLNTLEAGYRLNTSRLQLLNVLEVQSSIERLMHVAHARHHGLPVLDLRKLEQCMTEVRRTAVMAGEAWNQAGSLFTRLTRLLPVQLEEAEPCFKPIEFAEMERLVRLCAPTRPGAQVPALFFDKQVHYEKAAAEVAMTAARLERASNALRSTESAFRMGARDAHEFASALIGHSQQRREWMQKTVQACFATYTLYAQAKLLPERLGLA